MLLSRMTAATVGGAPNSDELYGNAMESLNEGETLGGGFGCVLGVEPIAPRWLLENSRMLDDFSQVFERIGGIPKEQRNVPIIIDKAIALGETACPLLEDLREALRVDKINDEKRQRQKNSNCDT